MLVVDDDEIILVALSETMAQEPYQLVTTSSANEALDYLQRQAFAVIISDQRMAEMEGLEFLQRARKLQPHASRILITGVLTLKTVIDAINTGEIYRFIAKPWMREELLATVRGAIQRNQLLIANEKLKKDLLRLNEQLTESNTILQEKIAQLDNQKKELDEAHESLSINFEHSLELCQRIITAYHPRLGEETRLVVDLCEKMLECGHLAPRDQHTLRVAAWLHNIGLIGISRELYSKAHDFPESMTDSEASLFHHHPIYGQTLAAFVDTLEEVGICIRASHERWDGTGFPDGLAGENIPLPARYLAVAVFFVESGLSREEAIEAILRQSGKAFEPEAVRLFMKATRMIELPRKVREVLFAELREGMVLAKGVYSPTGLLLMPEGHTLDEHTLHKIRSHNLANPIAQRLLVYH